MTRGHFITGFDKYDSATSARDALQVSPDWSDCQVRGTFDTLQVIDDMYVPTTNGNTTSIPEPFTVSYPEYGNGGAQQFRVDKVSYFPLQVSYFNTISLTPGNNLFHTMILLVPCYWY